MFNNDVKKLKEDVKDLEDGLRDLYRIVNSLLGHLKLEANKKRADWEIVEEK